MATCRKCLHWDKCSKQDGTTLYYNDSSFCGNVEDNCGFYINKNELVPKSEVDDLKRYIILSEDIAIKCKRENGEDEKYWKGKINAFKQIRAYIDSELKNAELKKKYTESEDKE